MEKIIDKMKKDQKIRKIMRYFERQFTAGFERLYDPTAFGIRDTLFRRWYYSSMLQMSYLNPSFLVNSIMQNKNPGDYVIMPHIKAFDNEMAEAKYKYDFKVFGVEDHPVLLDLRRLLNRAKRGLHLDRESGYVIMGGEKFIDKINFRNTYYLIYLVELAQEMKLLTKMASIGTVCFQPSQRYYDFLELHDEEQLVKVVDKSLDLCVKIFNEECYMLHNITRGEMLRILDNGVDADSYEKLRRYDKMYLEDIIQTAIEDGLTSHGDNTPEDIVRVALEIHISKTLDMWFTCVFGYYLGIIQPNYFSCYSIPANMEDILRARDNDEREGLMFRADHAHDLTVLGDRIVGQIKNINPEKGFKRPEKKHFKDIMEEIDIEMTKMENWNGEDILEELMKNIEALEEMKMQNEDEPVDLMGFRNSDVEAAVKEHVDGFYMHLLEEKNLKEATCLKHAANIWDFMMEEDERDNLKLTSISAEDVQNFMDLFVADLATSKTNVKENLVSIGKYAAYMESIGYIDKEELNKIKDICKRKDSFVADFERVMKDFNR